MIFRKLHRVFLLPQVLVLWFLAKKYGVKHLRIFVHDVLLIRRSGLFLLQYYRGVPPESDAGFFRELQAISHFVSTGAQEGLDPNPLFSICFYLTAYPDVGESGLHLLRRQRGEEYPRPFRWRVLSETTQGGCQFTRHAPWRFSEKRSQR